MDLSLPILSLATAAVAGSAAAVPKLRARLALSRAKHRSLSGHSKMSRLVARLIPFYEFGIDDFFNSDGAPAQVAAQRKDGFFRLANLYRERFAKGRALTLQASERISDLQFTESYRVPFQYSRLVREHLGTSAFVESSAGVTVTDLDGNVFYDLTGSYGVNIFGNDFYKECIASAEGRAHALGPVLGPYHPVIVDNVNRLCAISGLDEVSFHMSGTEAVMQAVRLARYHTRRSHLVRFAGAYHGWWGDVQPGVGNPIAPHETYTLAEMSERTLRVLGTRRDIACVLVNPLQALHPNGRNCCARKKAAIGSAHKYQTPCKKTAAAINGVIHRTVHHLGGVEPCRCQASKMTDTAAMLNTNGRPSRKRCVKSDTCGCAARMNAASHASGRFRQATTAPLPTRNSIATENTTSAPASQFSQR